MTICLEHRLPAPACQAGLPAAVRRRASISRGRAGDPGPEQRRHPRVTQHETCGMTSPAISSICRRSSPTSQK